MPTEYSEKDKAYGVEMGNKTSRDFDKSIKMASWGTCDCDDGLEVGNTTIKLSDKFIYKPKAVWYKKILGFIKSAISNIWNYFFGRKQPILPENAVPRVTDNAVPRVTDAKLAQISRLLDSRSGEKIPVNMVRNKKSGVVVVFPGSADKLRSFYGDKADDYEVVESQIK